MKTKRVIASALAYLMLTAAVTGCSSGDSKNDDSKNSSVEPTSSASDSSSDSAPAGDGEQVTIKIAQMMNEANSIERLNEIFSLYTKNEDPNVKIEATYIAVNNSWADFISSVSTMVAAGDSPDVVLMAIEGVEMLKATGLVNPLNNYLDAHPDKKDLIFSNMPENLIGPFEDSNGNIYSTLMSNNNVVVHCNTKLFEEAGIEIPQAGSWGEQEFLEICEKLTKVKDNGEQQYAFYCPNEHFMFSALAYTWGVDFTNDDMTESTLATPEMVTFSEFLHNMTNVWKYSPVPQSTDDYTQMLVDGRVAMTLAGRWPTAVYANNEFTDVAITTIPAFRKDVMVYGMDGYCVLRDTKHYDEAAAVAVWTSTTDFLTEYLTSGNIPCNPVVFEQICGANGVPKNWELFYNMDYVKNCRYTRCPAAYSEMANIIGSVRTSIYAGETTDYLESWTGAQEEVNNAFENFVF